MVTALGAEVTLIESLLCVPLSMAATFVPISVGGAGVREAAFVAMFGFVGVGAEVALAGSLLMYAVQLSMGAIGGLVQMRRPEKLPGQP